MHSCRCLRYFFFRIYAGKKSRETFERRENVGETFKQDATEFLARTTGRMIKLQIAKTNISEEAFDVEDSTSTGTIRVPIRS